MEDNCRSCGSPIWWLRYTKTGKKAPIERNPDPKGNLVVDLRNGTYSFASSDAAEKFLNHFITCPEAARWHKGARPTKGGRP